MCTRWSECNRALVEVQYQDATLGDFDESATESGEDNANYAALDLIRKLNSMFQFDLKPHDLSCKSKISFEKFNSRRKRRVQKVIRSTLDKMHVMTINTSLSNVLS